MAKECWDGMSKHTDDKEQKPESIPEISRDWVLSELRVEIEKNNSGDNQSEQDHTKIGWFSPLMERNDDFLSTYCTPKELVIGPVCKDHYQSRMLKVKLAAKFVKSFCPDKTEECLLKEIDKKIGDLRACFDEQCLDLYGDGTLASILFLDGCAILGFIWCYVYNELEEIEIDNERASGIREDLFLLKNQIPFEVLKLLVNSTKNSDNFENSDNLKEAIVDFLHINNMMAPMDDWLSLGPGHRLWDEVIQIQNQNALHLLDILHTFMTYGYHNLPSFVDNSGYTWHSLYLDQIQKKACLRLPRFGCIQRNEDIWKPNNVYKRFFRTVQELKSTGIKFKPISYLASVSFSSKCFIRGHLKLPSLTVDKWTERKLMNMVAYEMCLKGIYKENCYFITSYIKFMDFLIDTDQDVKELRESRILWNRLSSDEEVTKLFNNLGSKCFEPPRDRYSRIKTKIQIHSERKCAIWMAQVFNEHFSSPWTVIALLAAIIVLSLTAVQTWYAVLPKD